MLAAPDLALSFNLQGFSSGAVYVAPGAVLSSLSDSVVRENGNGSASAVHVDSGGSVLSLSSVLFERNAGRTGGALSVSEPDQQQPISITGCNFTGNWAVGSGGAVHLSGVAVDVTLAGCSFLSNVALAANNASQPAVGGALSMEKVGGADRMGAKLSLACPLLGA